jgi:hypothetical protein
MYRLVKVGGSGSANNTGTYDVVFMSIGDSHLRRPAQRNSEPEPQPIRVTHRSIDRDSDKGKGVA